MPRFSAMLMFNQAESGAPAAPATTGHRAAATGAAAPLTFDAPVGVSGFMAFAAVLVVAGVFLLGRRHRQGFLFVGSAHGIAAAVGGWLGQWAIAGFGLAVLLLGLRGFVLWGRASPSTRR